MSDIQAPIAPPYGIQPVTQTCVAFNRTGGTITQGYVAQLDLAESQSETTAVTIGTSSSVFANAIAPADATPGHILLVLLSASVADNGLGVWATSGQVYAKVKKASGSVAVGDKLTVATDGTFTGTTTTGNILPAIAQEAATTPTSAVLKLVLFNVAYPGVA